MVNEATAPTDEVYTFGPFRLLAAPGVLERSGVQIKVSGRALLVLLQLVRRAGQVVTTRELMSAVWPDLTVSEANLRTHVSALRVALRDNESREDYIATINGRGYAFTAPTSLVQTPTDTGSAPAGGNTNSATRALRAMIGREEDLAKIIEQLHHSRLVTIVGPGGVGKTTLGTAVLAAISTVDSRPIHNIELAGVDDPSNLVAAFATKLGISTPVDGGERILIEYLQTQDTLLFVDNCDHIIDSVAALVEKILANTDGVNFLATSREPILVDDEFVHRLGGLKMPASTAELSVPQVLAYPAVELFMARASAPFGTDLSQADASAVAEICRRMDGLPLAIELVAARVDTFGVQGLMAALEQTQLIDVRKSRTASRRQQSLRGTVDWSYGLLSEPEKLVLRRVAIFNGAFSVDSATSVAGDTPHQLALNVPEILDRLAAKSLINVAATKPQLRFRVLYTTRLYLLDKIKESGELFSIRRRHAEHFLGLLTAAEARWETLNRGEWLEQLDYTTDDIRAALDWAFSSDGDIGIGITLTVAALPLAFQMSLIDEFRQRTEFALAEMRRLNLNDPLSELRLTGVLAANYLNTCINQEQIRALYDRLLILTEQVGAARYKIQPLLFRAVFLLEQGDILGATESVALLSSNARMAGDPVASLLADRIGAQVYHFAGEHARSRELAQFAMSNSAGSIPLAYSQQSVDRRISMRMFIARSRWIEGFPAEAGSLMTEAREMATSDAPFALSLVLALGACPFDFWIGDLEAARRDVDALLDSTRKYSMWRWRKLAECYDAALRRRTRATNDLASLEDIEAEPASPLQRDLLVTIDPMLVDPEMEERASTGLCGWCGPELLRAAGERHLRLGQPGAEAMAEGVFAQSLDESRRQGAMAWELRTSMSIANLRLRQGRPDEGYEVLHRVLARFSEGHRTIDLQRGFQLLRKLGS